MRRVPISPIPKQFLFLTYGFYAIWSTTQDRRLQWVPDIELDLGW
jgi:hypothetical protein